ncbi:glycoside hydrolase [Dichomitus squalens LYAD-421 SS1]|uniref:Beta-mannosidase B n=1 Tax=Dichomitus squalens (strain LYAD-421) TaxID=732165 RepID=R7SHX1_DICSQ|nr:glycoside hydrolase [Dichomitus squalens LYAD-421 SS1]EJF55724.1 glycoside hydrolase [Dichomitus squalens LYAD-421 SS1]
MSARVTNISQGWAWKERDASIASVLDEVSPTPSEQWMKAAAFPSEVHVELLKAGRIPDPFIGFNEHEVQWIGETEWLYRTTFDVHETERRWKNAELVFEGLDTICDVYLNGKKVLYADNMFRTWRASLSPENLQDQGNVLFLHFKSAQKLAKELEATHGRVRAGSCNLGDPSRVYVRKAQYNWRWDWGPELMTCGPYRAISLVTYTARIDAANTRALVSAAPALSPSLKVDLVVAGDASAVRGAKIVLGRLDGSVIREEEVSLGGGAGLKDVIGWDLEGKVELWWPVGYGSQTLYNVEISLLGEGEAVLDTLTRRVGFRTVSLIQEPLEEPDRYGKGTTFLFEVNGVRMFMGGSNWIPAHNFLTALSADDYRAWLTLLRDGNQNMVRLWGGGVYEPDVFYDICDELGVLVWQDFQFACGVYPAYDSFVQSVRAEVEDNVKRLRHHPSIAIFCGNNEGASSSSPHASLCAHVRPDYQMVLQWGGIDALPARVLYEEVFPAVVAEHCDPPIPYHRGSPYGGKGWDTADPTMGDVHQWNIWGGKEWPWQEYPFNGGRFVSEFGIPSFPDVKTVDYWLGGNTKDRWAQSKMMAQHDRAGSHERRFAIVMNENFRLTDDLETHIYNTQLMQSEAISLAYRSWRREWRGKGKQYTAGVLVWQMNDCWPVISWAIADFFLRAKPAYYTIARELRPISVGLFRTVTQNRENDRPRQFYEFGAFRSVSANIEVWGVNATLSARDVRLELSFVDLCSGWEDSKTVEATLLPNQTTEIASMRVPGPPAENANSVDTSYSVVVGARLVDAASGEILARYADWPQPFRLVDFPDPGLDVKVEGEKVHVKVQKPVKGLLFTADEEGEDALGRRETVRWSDNAIDVFPGDPQVVEVRGLAGKRVKVRAAYMGCERGRVVYGQ